MVVNLAGEPPRAMDPAPAYDENIPHDLVHYVVEAELGLTTPEIARIEGSRNGQTSFGDDQTEPA